MNYLITGGAGFIGSHLTEKLLRNGNSVYVCDDLSSGYEKNLPENKALIFLKKKMQGVNIAELPEMDGIFHLGAQASVPVSIEDFYQSSTNNLNSSLKVFELAKRDNSPVVYASSSAIYGNLPVGDDENSVYEILSPYAQDKLTIEEYAKVFFGLFNISSIGLRFFNVYGPRQDPLNPYSGVISVFIDRFINALPVIINGGFQTRDFIYVEDVVQVMINSMEYARKEKTFDFINVGTGISISIDELFNKLAYSFGYEVPKSYKQLPTGDPEKSSGTFNKLTHILKINQQNFYSIDNGLKKTIEFFRDIKNEKI